MRVLDLIHLGVNQLAVSGIEHAERDVEFLLGLCLRKNRAGLFLAANEEVDAVQEQHFLALLTRRASREPLAYILGEQEFWSLPFLVNAHVLIPRPETEFLVETVLAATHNGQWQEGPILDLCCGSGVIGIVLALELAAATVTAVDISPLALQVARHNAQKHKVDDRLVSLQADLLSAFVPSACFSLVVSNPPYVSQEELHAGLQPEVAHFEPHLALDGGVRGLDIIKRIQRDLSQMLRPGGDFFMEIGADQGQSVLQLFAEDSKNCFELLEVLPDYSGRDRVFHARKMKT